jgi:hypothetical protein
MSKALPQTCFHRIEPLFNGYRPSLALGRAKKPIFPIDPTGLHKGRLACAPDGMSPQPVTIAIRFLCFGRWAWCQKDKI